MNFLTNQDDYYMKKNKDTLWSIEYILCFFVSTVYYFCCLLFPYSIVSKQINHFSLLRLLWFDSAVFETRFRLGFQLISVGWKIQPIQKILFNSRRQQIFLLSKRNIKSGMSMCEFESWLGQNSFPENWCQKGCQSQQIFFKSY